MSFKRFWAIKVATKKFVREPQIADPDPTPLCEIIATKIRLHLWRVIFSEKQAIIIDQPGSRMQKLSQWRIQELS